MATVAAFGRDRVDQGAGRVSGPGVWPWNDEEGPSG